MRKSKTSSVQKKIRLVTRILIEAKYYGDLSIIYFSKIEIHAYIHRHDRIYIGSNVILPFEAHRMNCVNEEIFIVLQRPQ